MAYALNPNIMVSIRSLNIYLNKRNSTVSSQNLVLPNERCKLICKVSDDYLERSFIFSDRVEDGTPCEQNDDTQDICINGICVPFGCDYKYGSNTTEDACGVCNGQNRTCRSIQGQKIVSTFGL